MKNKYSFLLLFYFILPTLHATTFHKATTRKFSLLLAGYVREVNIEANLPNDILDIIDLYHNSTKLYKKSKIKIPFKRCVEILWDANGRYAFVAKFKNPDCMKVCWKKYGSKLFSKKFISNKSLFLHSFCINSEKNYFSTISDSYENKWVLDVYNLQPENSDLIYRIKINNQSFDRNVNPFFLKKNFIACFDSYEKLIYIFDFTKKIDRKLIKKFSLPCIKSAFYSYKSITYLAIYTGHKIKIYDLSELDDKNINNCLIYNEAIDIKKENLEFDLTNRYLYYVKISQNRIEFTLKEIVGNKKISTASIVNLATDASFKEFDFKLLLDLNKEEEPKVHCLIGIKPNIFELKLDCVYSINFITQKRAYSKIPAYFKFGHSSHSNNTFIRKGEPFLLGTLVHPKIYKKVCLVFRERSFFFITIQEEAEFKDLPISFRKGASDLLVASGDCIDIFQFKYAISDLPHQESSNCSCLIN